MPEKRVAVLLAPGFEEMEAVAVVDIGRRAGLDVVLVGTVSGPVASARGVRILADRGLDEVVQEDFDVIVLPGGLEGTENLAVDSRVEEMLRRHLNANRVVGAICAAPSVLDRHGLTRGKTITCHPACKEAIREADLSSERVVRDGLLVTGQAAGSAMEFALKLVEVICGPEKMLEVNRGVLAQLNG